MEAFDQIRQFLESGGEILGVIAFVIFTLWSLIAHKFIYMLTSFRDDLKAVKKMWEDNCPKDEWQRLRYRDFLISKTSQRLKSNINLIKTIVIICPLLGLMGTVTGMINVFDVMGAVGNSNTRLMASGISMATIPTLAGMVASLSGLYFGNLLEQKAKVLTQSLKDSLPIKKREI